MDDHAQSGSSTRDPHRFSINTQNLSEHGEQRRFLQQPRRISSQESAEHSMYKLATLSTFLEVGYLADVLTAASKATQCKLCNGWATDLVPCNRMSL